MKEKVNYEDDLFFLSLMVKNIEKSFVMNISLDFFAERQSEDIIFIHHTIQKIFRELTENHFLINRNQYLYGLLKVKGHFSDMLDKYLSSDYSPRHQKEILPEIRKISEINHNDQSDIRILLNNDEEPQVESDFISTEELNFLMAPGLDEEEGED